MEEMKRGNSDRITREYLDSLLVEMRHLDGVLPDTSLELYGEHFRTPIMMAALSHLNNVHDNGMVEMAKGAAMAEAVNWAGMGDKKELEEITATGARTIKIIKPYKDRNMVLDRISHAREAGVLAVGMDIDHAFSANGEYDRVLGYDMSPVSKEELEEFVKEAKIPFVVKGILSQQDAYKALEAGAKGLVVSHHHGIIDYAVPPLMILPQLLKVTDGRIPVFVDCGIISGMDAFKALALGATAVCAGRVIMKPLGEAGAEGVKDMILQMTAQLKGAMAKTGSKDIRSIDPAVIWKPSVSL